MDESNMVERMLAKGDKLRFKYEGFNFDELDSAQKFWINKLGMYSRYRNRIINRFNGNAISSDIKIMFLD